jgi:hypothetical protein
MVSIHQPSYFPWLGLLHKINKSHKFILMDEVQLADRAFQHRNNFMTKDGRVKMLTVNINKKDYRDKNIKDLTLSNPNWNLEHKNFLNENYKNTPFFNEVMTHIEGIFSIKTDLLIDVLQHSILCSLKLFDIKTEITKMSEMNYDKTKQKSDLILELVQKSGSTTYLSGTGAKEYMNIDDFSRNGIEVVFQDFSHPQYHQKNSPDFISGLSCLDMLFNEGIENSRKIFKSIK